MQTNVKDAYGVDFVLTKEDFTFVQQDKKFMIPNSKRKRQRLPKMPSNGFARINRRLLPLSSSG